MAKSPESRRTYYQKNREKILEINKKTREQHPEYEKKHFARNKMIRDRAKKAIAKLDELESCDMAEILFGEAK